MKIYWQHLLIYIWETILLKLLKRRKERETVIQRFVKTHNQVDDLDKFTNVITCIKTSKKTLDLNNTAIF